jgi:flagellar hook protein FlgE
MSINTAASGLTAAQTGLDTVSNDLANASTTGFKNQTSLFSAIYAANQADLPGIGVQSAGIDTNFSQGNQVATGNVLDAAIQGDGFFVVNNGPSCASQACSSRRPSTARRSFRRASRRSSPRPSPRPWPSGCPTCLPSPAIRQAPSPKASSRSPSAPPSAW